MGAHGAGEEAAGGRAARQVRGATRATAAAAAAAAYECWEKPDEAGWTALGSWLSRPGHRCNLSVS